jgi:hypothetical protein
VAITVPALRKIRPKLGKRGNEPIRAYLSRRQIDGTYIGAGIL